MGAVNETRIIAAEAHEDALLPRVSNGAPQDASRRACAHDFELRRAATLLGQTTTQDLTLVHDKDRRESAGSFANAQSARHWRHESRRSDKATTVKLFENSRHGGHTGSHAEPKGQRSECSARCGLSLRACSPSRCNREG